MHMITEHFGFEENWIRCPCCNRIKITPIFFAHMEKLEQMRQYLRFRLIIPSGYRCPDHNAEIGGATKSQHMIFATDVRPEWGDGFQSKLEAMYKWALSQNWGGIGLYEGHIHLDTRLKPNRW